LHQLNFSHQAMLLFNEFFGTPLIDPLFGMKGFPEQSENISQHDGPALDGSPPLLLFQAKIFNCTKMSLILRK